MIVNLLNFKISLNDYCKQQKTRVEKNMKRIFRKLDERKSSQVKKKRGANHHE